MTPHNEANKEDIMETVLMPGDPLRAKYIADNFLEDVKLVNQVRNMYAYTGTYKGKKITVFSHGMGIPSMGIYAYELFKFYDVKNVIRIGSCGVYSDEYNLLDTLLVDKSYTDSNFALGISNKECHITEASSELNDLITETASANNIKISKSNAYCAEVFDWYVDDLEASLERLPKDLNITSAEMESFALFYLAKKFNRRASCLLTVVDSHSKKEEVSAEARQNSLNDMIRLALETAIKL